MRERQKFIEDFYANHPQTSRNTVKAEIFELQSKRAISLPNVLDEKPFYEPHNQRERKSSSRKEKAKYSEDLLLF